MMIPLGFDEVGRGPWAGPVVACCAYFTDDLVRMDFIELLNNSKNNTKNTIKDSKALSAKQREKAYDMIEKNPNIIWSIGFATPEEIDQINILQATFLAMHRAYQAIKKPEKPYEIWIDGSNSPKWKLNIPIHALIKGDQKMVEISVASICAKKVRDQIMSTIGEEYPQYHWKDNSGYGTKSHQEALKEFGITQHHRKSFKPIRKIIEQET